MLLNGPKTTSVDDPVLMTLGADNQLNTPLVRQRSIAAAGFAVMYSALGRACRIPATVEQPASIASSIKGVRFSTNGPTRSYRVGFRMAATGGKQTLELLEDDWRMPEHRCARLLPAHVGQGPTILDQSLTENWFTQRSPAGVLQPLFFAALAIPLIPRRTLMALIIIADDDPMVCDIVRETLTKRGHIVGVVDNGNDAVRVAEIKRPDLIILDCSMPLLSGVEALRRIRNSRTAFATPALMLTARSSHHDEDIALRAGASEYLRKPFDPAELIVVAEQLLKKSAAKPTRATT